MSRRHYVNNAAVVTITGALGTGDVVVNVSNAVTFPTSFPWSAVINAGQSNAEEVLVTSATGTALTVTRGYDGAAAATHASGETFAHVATAADYDQANSHINTSAGVHGITGSVVGTTDTQTLTNKTLTTPTITSPTITGSASVSGTLTVGGLVAPNTIPTGTISMFGGLTPPSNWLLCDGSQVDPATYPDLFAALTVSLSGTITLTGYAIYQFTTASTAQLGPGMTVAFPGNVGGAVYAAIASIDSSTQFTTTAFTALSITGSQTIRVYPFGLGSDKTKFQLPNLGANVPIGASVAAQFPLGTTGGSATHNHDLSTGYAEIDLASVGSNPGLFERSVTTPSWTANKKNSFATNNQSSTVVAGAGTALGGNTADNAATYPPYQVVNFIIKT